MVSHRNRTIVKRYGGIFVVVGLALSFLLLLVPLRHLVCVGAKTCRCVEHTTSWKDLLDGIRLEICLASTQDQSTLRILPEGVLVNLTCN